MSWYNEILKTYDSMNLDKIYPVAHTRVQVGIGIMLTDSGDFVAAAQGDERITIPCTCESETRTSNIAPHPIHDKMSYVAEIEGYEDRHRAYMKQLEKFVNATHDILAASVYAYLQRGTIRKDIEKLINFCHYKEPDCMIVFTTRNHPAGISKAWTDYYLSTLNKSEICSITGEFDYIPDSYPAGIRFPGDASKLFVSNKSKLDNMPTFSVGYIASQKIVHTLQVLFHEGATIKLPIDGDFSGF